ncbi:MAG: type I asparaginase [Bacteroidales bacterium]|jgi:L-asparaginase|nr:type I asparaginase [Bacteroidales bacterium]
MEIRRSVLIIYTGGTIGMVNDPVSGALVPIDFRHISDQVPELRRFGFSLETVTFEPVIDSSEVSPDVWVRIARTIEDNYDRFDGFVVLHGTDTMAYSASALSFMLRGLEKPVIFTGAQLPIGVLRTDGKENLITAIEIAAARENGLPVVPEVCIYFENKLLRGNRTIKYSAEHFNAFVSPNLPPLAEAGLQIRYNRNIIRYPTVRRPLTVSDKFDTAVAVLRLFPGLRQETVHAILGTAGIRGLVLETYGTGNAPTTEWFLDEIQSYIAGGGIVLNVSQCQAGSVEMGLYETSAGLISAGVLSGRDITTEAAVTKMMNLFGSGLPREKICELLSRPLCGEMS